MHAKDNAKWRNDRWAELTIFIINDHGKNKNKYEYSGWDVWSPYLAEAHKFLLAGGILAWCFQWSLFIYLDGRCGRIARGWEEWNFAHFDVILSSMMWGGGGGRMRIVMLWKIYEQARWWLWSTDRIFLILVMTPFLNLKSLDPISLVLKVVACSFVRPWWMLQDLEWRATMLFVEAVGIFRAWRGGVGSVGRLLTLSPK